MKRTTAGRIQIEHNMAVTLVANPPTLQEIKVEGCCIDLFNNWTLWRVVIRFPFGIVHLRVVTRGMPNI